MNNVTTTVNREDGPRISVRVDSSKKVPLGEVCQFIRGVSFDKSDVSQTALPRHVPILRAGNIRNELILDEGLIWVLRDKVSDEQMMMEGDIAICLSSGSPTVVGKSAQLKRSFVGSVGAFCGIIRPSQRIDPTYVAYWLRSSDFIRWRDEQARGANIQNLRLSELGGLRIPLPPLEEQRRLASILHEQLTLTHQSMLATVAQRQLAERLSDRYLSEAFRNVLPLTVGKAHPPPPPGWRWRLLTDLARLESGHTPSRRHPEWWGGDVPWISLPDIRALDGKIAMETGEYTNEAGISNSSARVLPAGTVCLSRTASVGFVTIMGRPMATSQDFVNWVCGAELDPHFLAYLLRASRHYIRELASGAVHKTVYVPTVQTFEVCIPPLDEQKRIVKLLSEQLEACERLRQSLADQRDGTEQLPATFLRQAFSGAL